MGNISRLEKLVRQEVALQEELEKIRAARTELSVKLIEAAVNDAHPEDGYYLVQVVEGKATVSRGRVRNGSSEHVGAGNGERSRLYLAEWNSGKSTGQIAREQGLKSDGPVARAIRQARKLGLQVRAAGAPPLAQ